MAHTKLVIRISIIFQYLLRLYLIFPLSSRIFKATGLVLEKPWAGAAYNLLLYMLAGHVFGFLWYLLAIEQHDCWRKVCSLQEVECYDPFMDCAIVDKTGRESWLATSNISNLCDPNGGFYQFGIYRDALSAGVTSSSFFEKFFSVWWAFRNLSSLGQGLTTSTYLGEIIYAMILGITSLVLFGLLIGNMHRYLQSINARLEQWRILKTDTEQWMHHRQLPHEMKESIRRYNQHKSRSQHEEAILKSLPMDLRRTITRHLCIGLVRKVQLFNMMDEQMLDAICERLKPSLYDQGSCLVRLSLEMLFIVRGHMNSYTTNGGQANFFNSCLISPGDFCGEELVTWALDPRASSSITLPLSTRAAVAIMDIEAFSLAAGDLKFVASQFRRLNSKQLRHVFRFHSRVEDTRHV